MTEKLKNKRKELDKARQVSELMATLSPELQKLYFEAVDFTAKAKDGLHADIETHIKSLYKEGYTTIKIQFLGRDKQKNKWQKTNKFLKVHFE